MPRRDIQLRTIQRQILHFGPDEAIQMAQAIAERIHQESGIPKEDIAVYCRCRVNINGRGFRERIRPDVDLTREKRHLFWGYSWYHP